MMNSKLVSEIERQLLLKSEVTSIGPPYVALNGEELLAGFAAADARIKELENILYNLGDLAEEKCVSLLAENAKLREVAAEAMVIVCFGLCDGDKHSLSCRELTEKLKHT